MDKCLEDLHYLPKQQYIRLGSLKVAIIINKESETTMKRKYFKGHFANVMQTYVLKDRIYEMLQKQRRRSEILKMRKCM